MGQWELLILGIYKHSYREKSKWTFLQCRNGYRQIIDKFETASATKYVDKSQIGTLNVK